MILHLSKSPMCMICWGVGNWRMRLKLGQLLGIFFFVITSGRNIFVLIELLCNIWQKLKHFMEKNIKLHSIMHMSIFVTCTMYKFVHALEYLYCLEFFIIKNSTIHLVLHGLMCVMNFVMKNQVKWPKGNYLIEIMYGFKKLCGLSSIHGAIDVPHIHV